MRQLFLIAALFLLSGMATADFEIKDPALVNEEEANSMQTDSPGNYAIEGAGGKSCALYLDDRKQNGSMHYINLNWAKGFITGVNFIHLETEGNTQLGAGLDLDAMTRWLDNYCGSNRNSNLSDATASLVSQLIQ